MCSMSLWSATLTFPGARRTMSTGEVRVPRGRSSWQLQQSIEQLKKDIAQVPITLSNISCFKHIQ